MKETLQRKLQKTNNGQYLLTVPKQLVQAMDWQTQDSIAFTIEKGKIVIGKEVRK